MASNRVKKSAQLYDVELKMELESSRNELMQIAMQCGIDPKGLTKTDLIRSIQRQEGNFDCFASVTAGICDQAMCLWRKDCLDHPIAVT